MTAQREILILCIQATLYEFSPMTDQIKCGKRPPSQNKLANVHMKLSLTMVKHIAKTDYIFARQMKCQHVLNQLKRCQSQQIVKQVWITQHALNFNQVKVQTKH